MTVRRAYALAAAPWLVICYLLPWEFVLGSVIAIAAVIGAAAWLAGGVR